MNGVAVIDRVTIDCIFSGMAGFPGAGEELYTDRFSMTLGGGACVTPVRLGNMGVPVRYGTFWVRACSAKRRRPCCKSTRCSTCTIFMTATGSR